MEITSGPQNREYSPRNMSELAKTVSVDDRHINAPGVHQSWKSLWVPKMLSNSARNGLESAEYVSVDDRHVKTVSNSPRNGPESAQTVIVDDRHVSAPWSSTTMEIA